MRFQLPLSTVSNGVKYQLPSLRFRKTLAFLEDCITRDEKILDIGTFNPFTEMMVQHGYNVINTRGEDLDTDYTGINEYHATCYTAFEIFEHLLAPFNLLREIPRGKLVSSVPLKVWFAGAYWNPAEEWDRHYHEFEPRQYDWLLEKAGWRIIKTRKWASPDTLRPGIRPLLRFFTPCYYFVYAEKNL